MGRTRKMKNVNLGKSLFKKSTTGDAKLDRHKNVEENLTVQPTNMKSITEESSYDEFIATASLAGTEFTAEKLNVKFVSLMTKGAEEDQMTDIEKKMIVIPRRPQWTKDMTADELDEAEKETFLEWRRSMAKLQEKEGITPFERNIEVWRQLWRVIERSNIMVQIVDARNPLLYRCEDLEQYVREKGKTNVLLINKADFLSDKQRVLWNEYFKSINLPHAFYSAKEFTIKETSDEESEDEGSEDDSDEESEEDMKENEAEEKPKEIPMNEEAKEHRVLTRLELIDYLKGFRESTNSDSVYTVGLVGYPNVGKSSTINSLLNIKHTSVSSTPGKTKHFQTLHLEDDLILCDCPGLVMPAFSGSKGAMVLGGILPIDQLTNYHPAMEILVKRIPQIVLENLYGVTLEPNSNHEDFLNSYAAIRGFMTARGLPDCSRASRIVLKDYVNGKLEYNHPPPNILEQDFVNQTVVKSNERRREKAPKITSESMPNQGITPTENRKEKLLDTQFFSPINTAAHIKGRQMIPTGQSSSDTSSSLGEKPWRKQSNKNKKEKLRRVYRHLDI